MYVGCQRIKHLYYVDVISKKMAALAYSANPTRMSGQLARQLLLNNLSIRLKWTLRCRSLLSALHGTTPLPLAPENFVRQFQAGKSWPPSFRNEKALFDFLPKGTSQCSAPHSQSYYGTVENKSTRIGSSLRGVAP